MSDRLSAEQWSRYWEKGSITTFQGRFQNNYDGPVKTFWEGIFADLADDARIVDLATGNGALALLASQYSFRAGKAFTIIGIDYADIDPRHALKEAAPTAQIDSIQFLPRTSLERTGLPDAGVDAAISQFGFEYAEQDAAITEVSRILKPSGATFAVLSHHADSAVVRQAKEGVDQILMCEKSGIHGLITDLVKQLDKLESRGKDPEQDEKARSLRKSLNEHTAALRAVANQFRDPAQIKFYLENSMLPFNPQFRPEKRRMEKLSVLRDVSAESTAYKQRMRDLISSAQSDEEIAGLCDKLSSEGFTIDQSQPFVFEGTHFAHALVATR